MRGGRFLVSVVTVCLLVGCSSGSWTTVEDPVSDVRLSEAGLVYLDIGPAQECKLSKSNSNWDSTPSVSQWSLRFEVLNSYPHALHTEPQWLYMRNCLGVKHTTNFDLFKDAIYELAERTGLHECRAELVVFLTKRNRDHELPREEDRIGIWRKTHLDEFGSWTKHNDLDDEAMKKHESAIDEWKKRTELDTQEETNRLLELKKLECEREERKAEQEAKDND